MKNPKHPSLIEVALDLCALGLIGCFLVWFCNSPVFL
jgi:hypothetical protein